MCANTWWKGQCGQTCCDCGCVEPFVCVDYYTQEECLNR